MLNTAVFENKLYNDFRLVNKNINFKKIDNKDKYLIINNEKYMYSDVDINNLSLLYIYELYGIGSYIDSLNIRYISQFSPNDFNNLDHIKIKKYINNKGFHSYFSGIYTCVTNFDKHIKNNYQYIFINTLLYNVKGVCKGYLIPKKEYDLNKNDIYNYISLSKLTDVSIINIKEKYSNLLNYFN